MTGDSWYSGVDNLKRLKNHALGWLFAIESNRTVSATAPCVALPPASLQSSVDKGHWTPVQKLDIRNHLFTALCGYVQFKKLSAMSLIDNCYSVQRNLFNEVIARFIGSLMSTINHLNLDFQAVVNA